MFGAGEISALIAERSCVCGTARTVLHFYFFFGRELDCCAADYCFLALRIVSPDFYLVVRGN